MQPRSQLTEIDKVLSILLGDWGLKREDRHIVRVVSLIILVESWTENPPSGSMQERLIHAGVGNSGGTLHARELESPGNPSTRVSSATRTQTLDDSRPPPIYSHGTDLLGTQLRRTVNSIDPVKFECRAI